MHYIAKTQPCRLISRRRIAPINLHFETKIDTKKIQGIDSTASVSTYKAVGARRNGAMALDDWFDRAVTYL
jgi:hypothetical protein